MSNQDLENAITKIETMLDSAKRQQEAPVKTPLNIDLKSAITEIEAILLNMKQQRDEPTPPAELTKEQWDRVIDEKFLCKFWDKDESEGSRYDYLVQYVDDDKVLKYFDKRDNMWEFCELVRGRGIKQPHFRGSKAPGFSSDNVIVYYEDDSVHMLPRGASFNWDAIVAFIEV